MQSFRDAIGQICHTARGFRDDTAASVTIIFALSIFVILAFVGGAVDFARVYRAQSGFQQGLDSAVLAAARAKQLGSSNADAMTVAEAYIGPIKSKYAIDGTVNFAVENGGSSIVGNATVSLPTMFLKVIGFDQLAFRSSGTASFGSSTTGMSNVELVMMLDVTGSMTGQKIVDLQAAAQDLVDIVVSDNQSSRTSRVGLVPFSEAVKLDQNTFEAATGKKITGTYKGCVVERTGVNAYNDNTPTAGSFVVPLEDKSVGTPCVDGREIIPLTDKKSDLSRMIASLTAGGSTAGHLGTAWAWYLLSPNWSSVINQANIIAPYSDVTELLPNGEPKLRKIAVLMTDGSYNTEYSSIDSTTQARALCQEMKKTGIVVYTVGFQLNGDTQAIETLTGCASDASKFYDATTGDALRSAFRDIAVKATPLRLVQ